MSELPLSPEAGWNARYLDGEWMGHGDRESIDVTNPYTRETVANVPAGTVEDVDDAEAIELANDTVHGLSGSVHSTDEAQADGSPTGSRLA